MDSENKNLFCQFVENAEIVEIIIFVELLDNWRMLVCDVGILSDNKAAPPRPYTCFYSENKIKSKSNIWAKIIIINNILYIYIIFEIGTVLKFGSVGPVSAVLLDL